MDVLAGRVLLAQKREEKEKEKELHAYKLIATYDPSEVTKHEESMVASLLESLITAEDERILEEVVSLQEEALVKTEEEIKVVEDEHFLEILEDQTASVQISEPYVAPEETFMESIEVVTEVRKTNKKRKAEIK